jgi:hypothetical protein
LTPPLSFTHWKYALIMFGPSVKSVPGWCVSIVPMLIGDPVALTPGLVPHDEMSLLPEPPLVLVPPAALDDALEVAPPAAAELLALLLLLPHPASASSAAAASDASPIRIRGMT